MTSKTRTHDDYTVGWICALSKEQTAATAVLDEKHDRLPKPPNDPNTYTLGSIGKHNIVIACLPEGEIGTNSAATIATWMISTFPSIKIGLMVGIGGGIPPKVRLGDVVVSTPSNQYPGVVQWDLGKAEEGGEFKKIGSLNNPPTLLRTALATLRTENDLNGSRITEYLDEVRRKWPKLATAFTSSESLKDPLFTTGMPSHGHNSWMTVFPMLLNMIMSLLKLMIGLPVIDPVDRGAGEVVNTVVETENQRKPGDIRIHFGLIASGNQVIKDAKFRDRLNQRYDGEILCFEMEAAGLMNNFPCIVIRGICDYADSQKNYDWQEYASTVAAAFAKEFLQHVQPSDVDRERPVRDIINQVHDDVTHIRSKLDGKQDIEILDWLTQTDYGPQQSDIFNRRQPDTGNWFLESAEFQKWLTAIKQSLYCPGMPGAGKTMLTSVVVNYLDSKFPDDSKIGIAYIYFNYKKQEEQNTYNLLASVLKQLAQSKSQLPKCIKELYNLHKDKRTRPSLDEVFTAVQSVMMTYSRIFIIADALDECQTSNGSRFEFLSKMFNLHEKSGANLFVTSRFNQEITEKFEWGMSLEIRASQHDVRRYIDGHISRFPVIQRNLDLHEEVKTRIVSAVDGMFLLAKLHLDSLIGKMSPKAVRTALANLQTGSKAYDTAYDDAMGRIKGQVIDQENFAKRVLLWITCARRPLTTTELQHALAVELEASEFDEENLPQVEDMLSVCAGLVTVDEGSQIIRLVHYTTQEYFERTRGRWFPDAQDEITAVCLTYLSFSIFETGPCEHAWQIERRLQSFPFYSYSASNWGHHAPKDEASQKVIRFLQSEAKVDASGQVLMMANKHLWAYWGQIPFGMSGMTGLHLAGFFGLNQATDTLLKQMHCPHVRDLRGREPLWYAVHNRHEVTVKLFLAYGANVNAHVDDDSGETLLHEAVANGYLDIVKQLLAAGAIVKPDAKGSAGTVLLEAVKNGHKEVVKELLAAGADVNTPDSFGWTALERAASAGYEDIVKQLLAAGNANINAAGSGISSLQRAAELGHEEVVRQLIAAGADVNKGYTLEIAAENGHKEVVRQLIAAGADINKGYTLANTAGNGHTEIVQQLIAAGADVNKGYTLENAARNGHKEIVRQLIAAGADVNKGYTLENAAENDHEEVVQQLIAAGARINKRNTLITAAKYSYKEGTQQLIAVRDDINKGYILMEAAANSDEKEVIRQLIAAGADINPSNIHEWTLHKIAAENGYEEVIRQLLAAGANINKEYALENAAKNGHKGVIQQLIAAGADVNKGYALKNAAKNGHKEVVRQLIAAGANINKWSALTAAAEYGHKEVVQQLIAVGADVNKGYALMVAAANGHKEVVRQLIAAGANQQLELA